jgi:hypothetical protein
MSFAFFGGFALAVGCLVLVKRCSKRWEKKKQLCCPNGVRIPPYFCECQACRFDRIQKGGCEGECELDSYGRCVNCTMRTRMLGEESGRYLVRTETK